MSLRYTIVSQFTPGAERVTIVADPDGLLLDELISEDLRERGFEILMYDDPIAFRFEYESKYRSVWDAGETTESSAIIRGGCDDFYQLPYDLLQAGPHVSLSLAELFPHLSYGVISSLDRSYLETLYEAQEQLGSGTLGESESADFALRNLFRVDAANIRNDVDLLITLLRIHYSKISLPPVLRSRLVASLSSLAAFSAWPLDILLSDRQAFFDFLSENWFVFLDREAAKQAGVLATSPQMESATQTSRFGALIDLPFDHPEVRIYVYNLFSEGLLPQAAHQYALELSTSWVAVGLKLDPAADQLRRLVALQKLVSESRLGDEARYGDWLGFAQRWAELKALWFECAEGSRTHLALKQEELRSDVDTRFDAWVQKRYAGLHNQAPIPPVMLHHVPRALARELERSPEQKFALILLDGLALDQWVVLRNEISKQRPGWAFREQSVFAWVPTITSISRQALFAGKSPIYFQESLNTTSKEQKLWTQFWGEHGIQAQEISYAKVVGDAADITKIDDEVLRPQVRIIGIVVAKVDRIMHGEQLGMKGMHEHVRLWARSGFLTKLLDLLIGKGFNVCLTADHGNIEVSGVGSPAEGALAGYRGERVRVFESQALRRQVGIRYPKALEWPSVGLPDSYLPLLAAGRSAFIPNGEVRVSHGGLALEELIVPLVYVTQKAV